MEAIRKQYLEQIHELENENAQVRQQLQKVTLASSEFRQAGDQVSLTPPAAAGVPIRGTITGVDQDLASISVGAASGVREAMTFKVIRGGEYLGDVVVTRVEQSEAVGRLTHRQGTIVKGDRVTTGFD